MHTKPLHLFVTLADTLHFGRASQLCHLSPSALSRNIKQLEEQLGTELFTRDNRQVNLTKQGELFLEYARDALTQWHHIKRALQPSSYMLQGSLSLYCSVTASYNFLYDLLNDFRLNYPSIEVHLHTGDPALAVTMVAENEADLAIGARSDDLPHNIVFQPITHSALLFIAPANQPQWVEQLSGSVSAEAWSEIPFILAEQGLARQRTDEWLTSHGIRPTIYSQVRGNEAIVSLVSLGYGIGVAPQIVLDNSPFNQRIKVLPVTPALAPYDIGLFTRREQLNDPLIDAFFATTSRHEQQA